jgi:hypothetical protein
VLWGMTMTVCRLLLLHSYPASAEFPDAAPRPPGRRRSLAAAHAGDLDFHALVCLVLVQSAVHHMPVIRLSAFSRETSTRFRRARSTLLG